MKLLVLAVLCVVMGGAHAVPPGVTPGVPPQLEQDVQILSYENDNSGINSYSFSFELSDGVKREEQGQLKNEGSENEYLSVKGSYSWTDPDGVLHVVTYVADDNGFHPEEEIGPGGCG